METGNARKFNNANETESGTRHRKRSIVVSPEIYRQWQVNRFCKCMWGRIRFFVTTLRWPCVNFFKYIRTFLILRGGNGSSSCKYLHEMHFSWQLRENRCRKGIGLCCVERGGLLSAVKGDSQIVFRCLSYLNLI